MKEAVCTKSQNGCVVKDAFDDYHGTRTGYLDAVNRRDTNQGNPADVTNEIFLYKVLLQQAAHETQENACPNCPFVISDP